MNICPNCAAENPAGSRFCGNCGASLSQICASCGAANDPGMRFCTQCGTPFEAEAEAAAPVAPAAERRLVSVLFADLVGFTAVSEARDPEETRELLSRYFDTCRRLIGLYGGTVEKFIGDAVMAVWGTPVATEDDAERAVRAALDLVAAVSALGDEVGAPGLSARAGVLTGEAAVNVGAEGQGMVAGDLVNTASRIQSVAEPGSVFVGDATRRATEQTVAYEAAGEHELKGKQEAGVPLARAADRLGAQRRVEIRRARGTVRRAGAGGAAVEGALPRLLRGAQGASRFDHRHRRDRQVAARVGVLQVLRRDRRDGLLAPRPLSRLRGGRHVLGARGHGAHALPDRRGRPARRSRSKSSGRR